jgi:hypothetical protein
MKPIKISGNMFLTLLNSVYLNGTIEECVLILKPDMLFVQVVDLTNSVFISIQEMLDIPIKKEMKIGLGNLGILCKLFGLSKAEDVGLEIDNNRLVVYRESHGKFSYLLSETDVISTNIEDDEAIDKLKDLPKYSVDIDSKVVSDYLAYIGLVGLKVISFVIDEDMSVILSSGNDKEHNFVLPAGEAHQLNKKSKDKLPFVVQVYAPFFTSIIQAIDFEKGDPTLNFSKDAPLIITQNDNLWAILPISEQENSEED